MAEHLIEVLCRNVDEGLCIVPGRIRLDEVVKASLVEREPLECRVVMDVVVTVFDHVCEFVTFYRTE